MNREALHESLSAVMDNEADELELHRVLVSGEDAQLRAKWARYQLARAAMHRELISPTWDISAQVSARLAAEDGASERVPVVAERSRFARSGIGRLAIAASVTFAVLAGVRFYNHSDDGGLSVAARQAPLSTPVVQAVPASSHEEKARAGLQVVSENVEKGNWKEPKVQQAIQPASFNESTPVSATRASNRE